MLCFFSNKFLNKTKKKVELNFRPCDNVAKLTGSQINELQSHSFVINVFLITIVNDTVSFRLAWLQKYTIGVIWWRFHFARKRFQNYQNILRKQIQWQKHYGIWTETSVDGRVCVCACNQSFLSGHCQQILPHVYHYNKYFLQRISTTAHTQFFFILKRA